MAPTRCWTPKTSTTDDIGMPSTPSTSNPKPGPRPSRSECPARIPATWFSTWICRSNRKRFLHRGTDRVKVLFFAGLASPTPGEIYLTDGDANKIYTGTLVAEGTEGDSFGEYKYFNRPAAHPTAASIRDQLEFHPRSAQHHPNPQRDLYRKQLRLWSAEFSDGQSVSQDRDGDGMANSLEYSWVQQFRVHPRIPRSSPT